MKRRFFKLITVAAVVLIAMFVLTRAAPAQSYTYTTLDVPNSNVTEASGINYYGDIVGWYADSSGDIHGFLLYSGGTFSTLDDPNATSGTFALGINDFDGFVGYYMDSSHWYGFLNDNQNDFTGLDDPNSPGFTTACGINDGKDIVGYYLDSNDYVHGFLYSNDQYYYSLDDPNGIGSTRLKGINDYGGIVGYYQDGNGGDHGFLVNGSNGSKFTTLDHPNAVGSTEANGINDSFDIVGSYKDSSGNTHGFLYSGSTQTYTTIDDPSGIDTWAEGINDCGDIVGYYQNSNGGLHGFLATPQVGRLWQNASPTGGGWYDLSPFGCFYTHFSTWIYHQTLGWLYPYGFETKSIWFYDPQWDGHGGWWWTCSSFFPWLYSATEKEWLYYDAADSTPGARWFWNSSTGWHVH